jgi:lysophospholipase L1-like esterase
VANWWARRQRNKYYDQVKKRFPDRLRIVSEGDSWFQHPLVLDIIDHLSRVYAIYCVSAAGDTLRNYLSNEKNNGEYFLDALDEPQPSFFLISGGGNDILGSQFRGFLADNPDESSPEGENPKRFLKQTLFDELDTLMDIYKKLFGFLQVHKPNLQVIVHGYDYPVKLNDAKKGWLGKYMIEKGINRPKDRQAIIHLIMDTFNQGISGVAKDFPNVTYIDVRNTVRFNGVDQWYDEIHPNNDGFQQVAMKFMEVIDRIYKEKIGAKSGQLEKVGLASASTVLFPEH